MNLSTDWMAGFTYEVRLAFPWVYTIETHRVMLDDYYRVVATDGKEYTFTVRGSLEGGQGAFGRWLLQTEYNRKIEADTEDWYDWESA